MADQILEVVAGTKGTRTVYVKDHDGSALDLTARSNYVVKLYAKSGRADDDDDLIVNGDTLTKTDAANGVCSWTYDFTSDAFTDMKGTFVLRLTSGDAIVDEPTLPGTFIMKKNEWW
jgi:hypothetical protein